ncbi:pro-Pol polyprotein [Trichonephila inaurata madagascariensis]|uniref:Pro-Pol polyprotein n=1 Tax=Trichonephila inaurata madagascariensis TaxID=2747483 RepID=A0A8X7CTM1_9ARAC|nr:pro-Pol polyprotein [Trichonephila inaurata madagascariensis]
MYTFCEANSSSYVYVVYLRTEGKDGVNIQLLQAKSRAASLRKATVPRLELLACCIGAPLAYSMKEAMTLEDVSSFFWKDSTTVLYWIKNKENWGTFVNNRVKEINQVSTVEMWRHVPGQCNPSDLPSRGCTLKILLDSRWREGPQWLRFPAKNWPNSETQINKEEVSKE